MTPMNPFRYGKPVPPDRFVGRADVLRILFSRIGHSESTAVVGEPHMGKSSLLRYIADPRVQTDFGCDHTRVTFQCLDAHTLGERATPADFWLELAEPLAQGCADDEIVRAVARLRETGCRANAVIGLFNTIAARNRQTVVTIDEFDSLLRNQAFCAVDFFGLLRSVSTRTDGLAVVIASRLPVAELNRRTESLSPTGSPLFNNYVEVRLRPLARREVDHLLDFLLTGTAVAFSRQDREFVVRVSGRHPFLVQLAAAALFDEKCERKDPDAVYTRAGQRIHEQSRAYFDDLWRHLDPRSQVALVTLALADAGRTQDGREFDVDNLDNVQRYLPELKRLADMGLADQTDGPGTELPWRIGAQAFVPWLIEDVIPGTRDSLDFNVWLREREYDGLLTRRQRSRITTAASAVPKGFISWVGSLVAEIVKGLLKVKA